MAVAPIGSLGSLAHLNGPQLHPEATTATAKTGLDVGGAFARALDGLQATQQHADQLAVQAASGDLQDIHAYTIAASEASLATELTVAVRDRAVEAFNSIMSMQI